MKRIIKLCSAIMSLMSLLTFVEVDANNNAIKTNAATGYKHYTRVNSVDGLIDGKKYLIAVGEYTTEGIMFLDGSSSYFTNKGNYVKLEGKDTTNSFSVLDDGKDYTFTYNFLELNTYTNTPYGSFKSSSGRYLGSNKPSGNGQSNQSVTTSTTTFNKAANSIFFKMFENTNADGEKYTELVAFGQSNEYGYNSMLVYLDGKFQFYSNKKSNKTTYYGGHAHFYVEDDFEGNPPLSIEAKDYSTKWSAGDSYKFDGKLIATYADGTTGEVTPTDVYNPSLSSTGERTGTLYYEAEGKKLKCEINITVVNKLTNINIVNETKNNDHYICVGQQVQLSAKPYPSTSVIKSVNWSIPEAYSEYLLVDENGLVTALKPCTTQINITASTKVGSSEIKNTYYLYSCDHYTLSYIEDGTTKAGETNYVSYNVITRMIGKLICGNSSNGWNGTYNWDSIKSDYVSYIKVEDKALFKKAIANDAGNELEVFLANYDYLVLNKGFEDFIGRHEGVNIAQTKINNVVINGNTTIIASIIIVSAAIPLLGILMLKKKEN